MKRVSSTDNVVRKLEEQVQLITKIISAYKIPTPEFDKLVPHEYFTLETKKFLLLKAMNKDISKNPVLKPPKAVDDLWAKFMTCIEEYMMFCDSVLPTDSVNRYIEKIGYDDQRYPRDSFDATLKEYELRMNEKDMLETVLWNPRYKEKTYEELLDITKNSNGEVFHSPLYDIGHTPVDTGHSYSKSFRPPSGNDSGSYSSAFRAPSGNGTNLDHSIREVDTWRENDMSGLERSDSGGKRRKDVVETYDESKKRNTSSEKKRKKTDTFVRNEKCSDCNNAVGENNHKNQVTVYLDSDNIEYKIGHRGKCKK